MNTLDPVWLITLPLGMDTLILYPRSLCTLQLSMIILDLYIRDITDLDLLYATLEEKVVMVLAMEDVEDMEDILF